MEETCIGCSEDVRPDFVAWYGYAHDVDILGIHQDNRQG